MLRGDALEGRPESEVAQLAMARVLIVKGDAPSLERAQALLERLLQAAEAEGRIGRPDRGAGAAGAGRLAAWRTGRRYDLLWNMPCGWPNLKATCASSPTSGSPWPGCCRKPVPA